MNVLVVTGTGTEVGKTVTTAVLAAAALAAGRSVAVLKPAQTGVAAGEAGDVAEVARLAAADGPGATVPGPAGLAGAGTSAAWLRPEPGAAPPRSGAPAAAGTEPAGGTWTRPASGGGFLTVAELARYPDPLAPDTAARRAGLPPVRPGGVAEAAEKLAAGHDLVLVEGAGGLLVRFDEEGSTLADAARLLDAPVLVVAQAGLGTLNAVALTAEALRTRGLACPGVVVGSWPVSPGLAERCNLADLPRAAAAPLLGAVPAGAGGLTPAAFRAAAPGWLAARLGGTWEAAAFTKRWAADGDGKGKGDGDGDG
ncbi:ATP-dependent dethiobiotin synthetase BioD [Streptomyces sp. GC420]|uniref:ATP-dependent dethiobiotin synthetase BioD n=1 Tax=Streptomyces sp. GC420 TaxID=2697568 RepID=UPI0014151A3C|nr:dethiobiotin synthase [Streptomyces sp. GC420]NBM17695.1 AAA family ATPase [Streptomyces sp. GC420]